MRIVYSILTAICSSDLWAIGCTIYFLVVGTPAFAAINDYQSFRKIEALDYIFMDGFDDSAKDLIQRLLVCDTRPCDGGFYLIQRRYWSLLTA